MLHLSILWLTTALLAASGSVPIKFKEGLLPAMPSPKVGGGAVVLELSLDDAGSVVAVKTLRDTPPYTERLRDAVGGWRFEPARGGERSKPEEARVLVAGSFRPLTLVGPALGQVPQDLGAASAGVPFPVATAQAFYPPRAQGEGVVLVELDLDIDGTPIAAEVVRSAPGFDDAARRAALQWRFRPAREGAVVVASRVYVVFGFRQPGVGATPVVP